MIERSGLCQIKALNLLFSKNNATPILKAPTVYNVHREFPGEGRSMKIKVNYLQTTCILPVKIDLDIPSRLGRALPQQALSPNPGNK